MNINVVEKNIDYSSTATTRMALHSTAQQRTENEIWGLLYSTFTAPSMSDIKIYIYTHISQMA